MIFRCTPGVGLILLAALSATFAAAEPFPLMKGKAPAHSGRPGGGPLAGRGLYAPGDFHALTTRYLPAVRRQPEVFRYNTKQVGAMTLRQLIEGTSRLGEGVIVPFPKNVEASLFEMARDEANTPGGGKNAPVEAAKVITELGSIGLGGELLVKGHAPKELSAESAGFTASVSRNVLAALPGELPTEGKAPTGLALEVTKGMLAIAHGLERVDGPARVRQFLVQTLELSADMALYQTLLSNSAPTALPKTVAADYVAATVRAAQHSGEPFQTIQVAQRWLRGAIATIDPAPLVRAKAPTASRVQLAALKGMSTVNQLIAKHAEKAALAPGMSPDAVTARDLLIAAVAKDLQPKFRPMLPAMADIVPTTEHAAALALTDPVAREARLNELADRAARAILCRCVSLCPLRR